MTNCGGVLVGTDQSAEHWNPKRGERLECQMPNRLRVMVSSCLFSIPGVRHSGIRTLASFGRVPI